MNVINSQLKSIFHIQRSNLQLTTCHEETQLKFSVIEFYIFFVIENAWY